MKDVIYTILVVLTVLNAVLTLIAALTPITGKDPEKKRALLTIGLSWLIKKQSTTLYLSLSCLVLWVFSPGLNPEIIKLILCNLLTTGLILVSINRSKNDLNKLCAQESVAVVRLELQEKSFLEIWIKKSKEDWPPLYLEIGMGPWFIDAQLMSQSLKEKMAESMRGMFPEKVDELTKELKGCLNLAGATHPMDIRGAEAIPELSEFFEKCLLPKQPTS
jgi:hypothetical protein